MTYGDMIVLAVLGLIVGFVIAGLVRKKNRSCGCGCSCEGCAMAGTCHTDKK